MCVCVYEREREREREREMDLLLHLVTYLQYVFRMFRFEFLKTKSHDQKYFVLISVVSYPAIFRTALCMVKDLK